METLAALIVLGGSCICCVLASAFLVLLVREMIKIQNDKNAEEEAAPSHPEPATARVVKAVGFYREMQQGRDHHPSMHDAISRGTDSPQLVAYLKAGELLMMVPGSVEDPIQPEKGFIGIMHIVTDGTYCWPDSLAYFVENYAVELPGSFIQHIASQDWTAPEGVEVGDWDIDWS